MGAALLARSEIPNYATTDYHEDDADQPIDSGAQLTHVGLEVCNVLSNAFNG